MHRAKSVIMTTNSSSSLMYIFMKKKFVLYSNSLKDKFIIMTIHLQLINSDDITAFT